MSFEITSEEQYEKSLKWLTDKAAELEDPLLDDVKRAKLMTNYDVVTAEIRRYHMPQYYPPQPIHAGPFDFSEQWTKAGKPRESDGLTDFLDD